MSRTIAQQGLTNHVTIVLDKSWSMGGKEDAVIRAVDAQIATLAEMSQKMDQETRITVVMFSDKVDVVVYDKDVLRLPSISQYYRTDGQTALLDATMQSIEDLEKIPELYSDHAFLLFVITDGQENRSVHTTPSKLSRKLRELADNWTVAALVPDMMGEDYALKCGFPAGNILQWDVQGRGGFDRAAKQVSQATSNFMQSRAAGVRGTRSVFSTGADAVNAQSVAQAALAPLKSTNYSLVPVIHDVPIKQWVEDECGMKYVLGKCMYELSKLETIQGNKALAVVEKATGRVYVGDRVRGMLGLGPETVRVRPDHNDKYKVFVQSTSVNRKLKAGTQLLILK